MLIYAKQKNFCLWFLRKEKREYLANLNDKDINDKLRFWKKKFALALAQIYISMKYRK